MKNKFIKVSLSFILISFSPLALALENLIVVAKSGGDFTDPVAAMASITDSSPTKRYLIDIAPGTYNLNGTLTLKPFVSVTGAGSTSTFLSSSFISPLIELGANTELRNLGASNNTVSSAANGVVCNNKAGVMTIDNVRVTTNNGASSNTIGININNCNLVTISNSVISSNGGDISNIGILNRSNSVVKMRNVSVVADFAFFSVIGISNHDSHVTMNHVDAVALDGNAETKAIENNNSSVSGSDLTFSTNSYSTMNVAITNDNSSVILNDTTATAIGTDTNTLSYAVYNIGGAPLFTNSKFIATGGKEARGIYNKSSSPTIERSLISVYGTATNTGIYSEASSAPILRNISIAAVTGTSASTISDNSSPTFVGSSLVGNIVGGASTVSRFITSQLGSPPTGAGTFICQGSYNPSLVSLNSSCQ